jgi:sugar lactone lactonase YvrE
MRTRKNRFIGLTVGDLSRSVNTYSAQNFNPERCVRLPRLIFGSVCLVAFCLVALTSPLAAQTAHSGATVPVGSGFTVPAAVAVDRSGNVFVADENNNAVKEIVAVNGVVSSNSNVITVGSGFNGPLGVAVDGGGNVFVADAGNSAVKAIVSVNGVVSSSSNVITVGSGFSGPEGVAVDGSGNVFVADTGNNAVKEIVAVNGVVSSSSTVNTIGSGFSGPTGVAVDGSGNVFFAGAESNVVKEIVAVNGVVSSSSTVITIGSGFVLPTGVAVDGSGNVFVSDTNTNAVKEIVAGAQKFPTTQVGSASAALTIYFTFDSGGSLAATPYLVLTQGAQNLDFKAAATQASDACVTGQAYNAGDICTVNVTFTPAKPYQRIGAVQLMGSAGTPIATFYLRGTGAGPQVIFPSNSTVNTIGSGFSQPNGVAVDGSGNVFVADYYNSAVREIVAVNGVVSSSFDSEHHRQRPLVSPWCGGGRQRERLCRGLWE